MTICQPACLPCTKGGRVTSPDSRGFTSVFQSQSEPMSCLHWMACRLERESDEVLGDWCLHQQSFCFHSRSVCVEHGGMLWEKERAIGWSDLENSGASLFPSEMELKVLGHATPNHFQLMLKHAQKVSCSVMFRKNQTEQGGSPLP